MFAPTATSLRGVRATSYAVAAQLGPTCSCQIKNGALLPERRTSFSGMAPAGPKYFSSGRSFEVARRSTARTWNAARERAIPKQVADPTHWPSQWDRRCFLPGRLSHSRVGTPSWIPPFDCTNKSHQSAMCSAYMRRCRYKLESGSVRHDTLSERLRRWTRNPLGSARRGSNPLGVVLR